VLRFLKFERGVEIHHDGDLPARSGMGSSSAFTVGLLHALHALKGYMPSKHQLAMEGIHIEQEALKETVGSQDQVLAAYGGFNHITFMQNGEISVRPITVTQERMRELNSHLMLFYTGIKRTASEVAQSYVADIDGRKRQLRIMKDLVEESISVLNGKQDLRHFGELLHEAWHTKRSLSSKVSNSMVEEIYNDAVAAGAVGGKLLGAGGGGFMLLFVPFSAQEKVKERLSKLIFVPFKFEFSGTQIIFHDAEVDYSEVEKARAERPIQAFQELRPSHVEQERRV
jgi:D-glycero-alpha-D-manno-heptose-7-phosphate kinase